jgi:hypothetical protein
MALSVAIVMSFFSELLYDGAIDSPDIQESTHASHSHSGGETVPAEVDDSTGVRGDLESV